MKSFILSASFIALLSGCGGGGSESTTAQATPTSIGVFLDSAVSGLDYSSQTTHGKTDRDGHFEYVSNEEVTFKVGNIILGSTKVDDSGIVTPLTIVKNSDINDPRVVEILRVLQTLDKNRDPSDGIEIIKDLTANDHVDLSKSHAPLTDTELAALTQESTSNLTSASDAQQHFQDTLNSQSSKHSSSSDEEDDEDDEDDEDEDSSDHNSNDDSTNHDSDGSTTGGDTGGTTGGGTTGGSTGTGEYTLLAWNDLGMHCMDGSEFSIFTILPPYNVLQAQLIKKDGTSNKHVTSGVTLSYQAMNYNGHINTTSHTKTNFWDYSDQLFPGTHLVPDYGLNGFRTPSDTIDSNMTFNTTENWFEAAGIPIINRDDDNLTNYYPLVRVTARDDATGVVLATAEVVLPISDEMDCARCHASTTSTGPAGDAKPTAGWENNTQSQVIDFKLNILRLHDEDHPVSQTDLDALALRGFNYQSSLYDTVKAGTPVLCAACHRDISLGATGQGTNGISSFTQAIHSKHADVLDPVNGLKLDNSANRTSCYACHPGAATKCLRGAMGDAVDANGNTTMQCQSCHGNLSDVGSSTRTEWTSVPNCQACHENGNRHTSALVNGILRNALDTQFATNANTPNPGTSVYRFSKGHGDLACESCHGSTHAIFPSRQAEDNLQSLHVQGHAGTIAECTSCHTTMPDTVDGGPHGMHTVGQNWVSAHKKVAEKNSAQCTSCHGADYRGTVLSKTFSARTLNADGKTQSYQAGGIVSCYDCHNKKW